MKVIKCRKSLLFRGDPETLIPEDRLLLAIFGVKIHKGQWIVPFPSEAVGAIYTPGQG
jgi:hypothetical protein